MFVFIAVTTHHSVHLANENDVIEIRTKFGICGHVKGWQRSGKFGRDQPILGKMGAGTNPAEPDFLCGRPNPDSRGPFGNFATADFHQIWSRNIVRCPVAESGKTFFETFHFRGHLPPKSEFENRSNRDLTKSRLQVTGCIAERYCLRCSLRWLLVSFVPHVTRSPATAGIANRPLLFLEHRIPMPELFTVRRFTRVLEAGKYGCPY